MEAEHCALCTRGGGGPPPAPDLRCGRTRRGSGRPRLLGPITAAAADARTIGPSGGGGGSGRPRTAGGPPTRTAGRLTAGAAAVAAAPLVRRTAANSASSGVLLGELFGHLEC